MVMLQIDYTLCARGAMCWNGKVGRGARAGVGGGATLSDGAHVISAPAGLGGW
jgi:hypothetical protein